ncbi:MAG: SDR family oxidoreductase [Planctomycetes bacterium]|nr:SDR family oxidoreductase [Planctomycetota bacterium]
MRCIVTGGAGFIGSHLVERLAAEGHRVRVLDDLSTGREANLAQAACSGHVELVHADVRDLAAIRPHFRETDWVFHLAARADIVPSITRPFEYHQANVQATLAVLEAARESGVRRLIYAASSSCYGIPDVYPTPETAPARPMYPYALTKYVGEQYVLHWAQVYGLGCLSLRLFNVFGPRSRTTGAYGAVFGVFLAQKLAGRPYTVVGDGTQTRDFTYVTDVAEAFLLAALSSASGRALNVGTGLPRSVNDLVDLLGGPVVHVPRRPGEPDRTQADASLARELLGWSPRTRFDAGVRVLLAGIEAWRGSPVWTPEGVAEATREWFSCLGRGEEGAA